MKLVKTFMVMAVIGMMSCASTWNAYRSSNIKLTQHEIAMAEELTAISRSLEQSLNSPGTWSRLRVEREENLYGTFLQVRRDIKVMVSRLDRFMGSVQENLRLTSSARRDFQVAWIKWNEHQELLRSNRGVLYGDLSGFTTQRSHFIDLYARLSGRQYS